MEAVAVVSFHSTACPGNLLEFCHTATMVNVLNGSNQSRHVGCGPRGQTMKLTWMTEWMAWEAEPHDANNNTATPLGRLRLRMSKYRGKMATCLCTYFQTSDKGTKGKLEAENRRVCIDCLCRGGYKTKGAHLLLSGFFYNCICWGSVIMHCISWPIIFYYKILFGICNGQQHLQWWLLNKTYHSCTTWCYVDLHSYEAMTATNELQLWRSQLWWSII